MTRQLLGIMTALGSAALVGAWAVAAPAAEFELVHATVNPKNHIDYPVNMDFVERVEEASGGRIEFRVFDSGVLGDEREMVEQLKSGTISTARLAPAVLGSICEGQMILNLPFLFEGGEAMLEAARSEAFAELCDAELIGAGIRPIGYWWMGVRDLYTKTPVKTLDDLDGLKVRTWQDPYVVATWKRLGAIPTPISFSELYTAMQTGIVDGGEGWAASYNARSFYEVAPNLTKLGYINIASTLVISEQAWSSLPNDLKAVVREAGQENSAFAYETFRAAQDKVYERARENGANVLEVADIGVWREATAPVIEQFAKDHPGPAGDFVRQLAGGN